MNKWTRPFEWNRASAAPAGSGAARAPKSHYYAFLSYSHQDAAIADWLHDELESFVVPSTLTGKLTSNGVIPSRLTPIFRDRHELAAADDLGEEIEEALASSHCLIVLCSPAAAASRWTNDEIATFKRLHPDGCIIAAITSGEPFASDIAGREAEECLPPALRQKYDRRGRPTGRRAEPLAADLRQGGGGRRLGFLKIVAGMLDVGLDDLVQREQLRRQRRLAWITAAALAAMLVAIALAVTAINARDAARDQRREAESLVEFMVGDLKDKLDPIGRLDVLDGVGSRVLAYYSKQDTSELTDAALLQRSRALSLMAQVAYQRGNLTSAQQLYHEAMAGTEEAVRRDPSDPQRLFDHAQNVFWIGEVARYRGVPDQAAAGYREYRRLAYRLAELEPDNLKYRMEVLYGEENVGISLFNQRHYAQAAAQFVAAIRPMEKLASLYPDNVTYQKEVAKGYYWFAEAQRSQGKLDAAIATRQQQLGLLDRLMSGGASDVDLVRQSVITHLALGLLFGEENQSERSLEQLQIALADAERLVAVEPKNAFWKTATAMAQLALAKEYLQLGETGSARQHAAAGCELSARLNATGAGIARVRILQTDCLTMRSRLALAGGDTAQAASAADRALASARSERNEDPVTDRYRVAAAFLLLGDVRRRAGDSAAAASAWNAGLAQLPQGVAERPADMSTRSDLLRRVGRNAEAETLAARLASIGYRSIM